MDQTVKLTYMGDDLKTDAKELDAKLRQTKKGHLQRNESGFEQDENGDLILLCNEKPDISLQLIVKESEFEWNPS